MKKILFSILLLTVILISVLVIAKQPREIVRPVINKINTDFFAIYKIELTDTATVVYMDAYNSPGYWVMFESTDYLKGKESGRIYKIVRAEGLDLNKKVSMPENGTVSFRLFFEPLSKEDTQLDFLNVGPDSSAIFAGIQLKAKPRSEKIHCLISGTVNDRPYSSRLIIQKPEENYRTSQPTYIPIHNGKFEYDLYCDAPEMYELCFTDETQKGSWRSFSFFAEPGDVNIQLFPQERYYENMATGAKVNKQYNDFLAEREKFTRINQLAKREDQLIAEKRYHTDSAMMLMKQAEAARENRPLSDSIWAEYSKLYDRDADKTPEAKAVRDSLETAYLKKREFDKQYAEKESSLIGLYLAYDAIQTKMTYKEHEPIDIEAFAKMAKEKYMPVYSSHVYAKRMADMLVTLDSIQVGGHYLDFSAPDLTGKNHRLSGLIGGKVALIDMWASWCGPCRRNSKAVIPLYNQYKERGFVIVGIARERMNTKAFEQALQEDQYPWIQLVELNDQNNIWNRYGIANAAGGTWLVDREGKILAVNPTPEEVAQLVKEQF